MNSTLAKLDSTHNDDWYLAKNFNQEQLRQLDYALKSNAYQRGGELDSDTIQFGKRNRILHRPPEIP